MPTTSDLKDEISQLKSDADRVKRTRRASATMGGEEEAETKEKYREVSDHRDVNQELANLTEKLSDLVEDAEHEIKERPVAMVLGAFALGVLVGALIRR